MGRNIYILEHGEGGPLAEARKSVTQTRSQTGETQTEIPPPGCHWQPAMSVGLPWHPAPFHRYSEALGGHTVSSPHVTFRRVFRDYGVRELALLHLSGNS